MRSVSWFDWISRLPKLTFRLVAFDIEIWLPCLLVLMSF
jgi:hypothetical protein